MGTAQIVEMLKGCRARMIVAFDVLHDDNCEKCRDRAEDIIQEETAQIYELIDQL